MAAGRGGGPAKKDPNQVARTDRSGSKVVLTEPGERFDPPDSIHDDRALETWEEYWADPVSSVTTMADRSLLRRWIELVQRYWQISDELNDIGLNENCVRMQTSLAQKISVLEANLGIGPKNRASLGVAIINKEKQVRNFSKGGDQADGGNAGDEPDPRL